MNENATLFRLLGDETRYKIVSILYETDSYVELLAETLALTPATVCFHLKKLESAGIVRCSRKQFYIIYSLSREIFEKPLSSFLSLSSKENESDTYKSKVLDSFFSGGRLVSIPVQEKKREIVLSEIMKSFKEESYTEKEVNSILTEYFEDFCTLRRWLTSDGFMSRDKEIYTVLKR